MWWWGLSLASAQTIPNPSMDGPTVSSIPNDLLPYSWVAPSGSDLARVGVPIDCEDVLFLNSANGGTFLRLLAGEHATLGSYNQSAQATVTGLVAGAPYKIRFEQSLVRHFGQSTGYLEVQLGGQVAAGPMLALPASNPGQAPWQMAEVGPFTATAASALLTLRAISNFDGITVSSLLPDAANGCSYSEERQAVDLLIDGLSMVGDPDLDTLYDDEEEALGTDPHASDTDEDRLADNDELAAGTDPLIPDSDDDGLLDGDEDALYGTDPLIPDSDGDGLLDGAEVSLGSSPLDQDSDDDGLVDSDEFVYGTDPTRADTDGDGLDDGEEIALGSDPLVDEEPDTDPQQTSDTEDPTAPTETSGEPLQDQDGDGVPSPEDCDDQDPDTYPGAKEDLSPLDRDCDGLSDPTGAFSAACGCGLGQRAAAWPLLASLGVLLLRRRRS